MTVVSAVIISDAIHYAGSLEEAFPIIVATFVLAGFLEAMMGVFRLGSYIRYMPYPVVSGFMSGIGVIIVITQVFPFFGVGAPAGGPMGTIREMHPGSRRRQVIHVFPFRPVRAVLHRRPCRLCS